MMKSTISVPFTDQKALDKLEVALNETNKDIDRLARELCLASNDPKPNRSLTHEEREQYRRMARVAFAFISNLFKETSKP